MKVDFDRVHSAESRRQFVLSLFEGFFLCLQYTQQTDKKQFKTDTCIFIILYWMCFPMLVRVIHTEIHAMYFSTG